MRGNDRGSFYAYDPALPELNRRFTEASRLSASVPAQKAEIAAVKAYNARVRAIGRAQSAIQLEIVRLQRLGA